MKLLESLFFLGKENEAITVGAPVRNKNIELHIFHGVNET